MLTPLPLRAEYALLCAIIERRSDGISSRPHFPCAVETHIDHEQARGGALEQDFFWCCDHGKAAFGVAEQVLRGYNDGKVFDRARPDQIAPGCPQQPLVGAGRHEDQLSAAQRQRARHFGHVGLAAHSKAYLAMLRVKHGEFFARHVLEFPPLTAGIDPGPVRVRAAIHNRCPAIAIGHADQIVRGPFVVADRLDGPVDRIDAVLGGGLRDARRRIEIGGHAPWTGVGLRKTDEVGPFRFGAGDEIHRIGNIFFGLPNRIGDWLHDRNAECHALLQIVFKRQRELEMDR